MKKMYNNPETEVVDLHGERMMADLTISGGGDANPEGGMQAPMRHVGSLGPSY